MPTRIPLPYCAYDVVIPDQQDVQPLPHTLRHAPMRPFVSGLWHAAQRMDWQIVPRLPPDDDGAAIDQPAPVVISHWTVPRNQPPSDTGNEHVREYVFRMLGGMVNMYTPFGHPERPASRLAQVFAGGFSVELLRQRATRSITGSSTQSTSQAPTEPSRVSLDRPLSERMSDLVKQELPRIVDAVRHHPSSVLEKCESNAIALLLFDRCCQAFDLPTDPRHPDFLSAFEMVMATMDRIDPLAATEDKGLRAGAASAAEAFGLLDHAPSDSPLHCVPEALRWRLCVPPAVCEAMQALRSACSIQEGPLPPFYALAYELTLDSGLLLLLARGWDHLMRTRMAPLNVDWLLDMHRACCPRGDSPGRMNPFGSAARQSEMKSPTPAALDELQEIIDEVEQASKENPRVPLLDVDGREIGRDDVPLPIGAAFDEMANLMAQPLHFLAQRWIERYGLKTEAASTYSGKLEAIAWLQKRMHAYHFFVNANGRAFDIFMSNKLRMDLVRETEGGPNPEKEALALRLRHPPVRTNDQSSSELAAAQEAGWRWWKTN